jgi:hypothetical protein
MGAQVTEHQDKQLECVDCKQPFTFSAKDQAFFEEKQFVDPKRCKPCRDIKKQSRMSQGR